MNRMSAAIGTREGAVPTHGPSCPREGGRGLVAIDRDLAGNVRVTVLDSSCAIGAQRVALPLALQSVLDGDKASVNKNRKQWIANIKEYATIVAWLAGILLGLALFGDVFRANPVVTTLFASAAACLLRLRPVWTCFTPSGLRCVRGILMGIALLTSLMLWDVSGRDAVRNSVGAQFVDGYRHWKGETVVDVNDEGEEGEKYLGDKWKCRNQSGKLALEALDWALLIALVALPWLTWKAPNATIELSEKLAADCDRRPDTDLHEVTGRNRGSAE